MSCHKTRTTGSTNKISREDATLRGSWLPDPFGASTPADTAWSDGERDTGSLETDGCCGGWGYGVISEGPERPGRRFHAPSWVRDLALFGKFVSALLKARKKEHPTLPEFQQSKSETDAAILRDYFVDHMSFQEIFVKYSRSEIDDAYGGVYDVSVRDAKNIEEAIEFAAQTNGTFSCPDKDGGFTFFDEINCRWRRVTARKINDKLFRVNFQQENGDKYFLPERLDPSKTESTRPMQKYISDLVDEGYALLKIAKPTAVDRTAARQAREAEEQQAIARAQLGAGTNAVQYEHTATLPDQFYKPSPAQSLQSEYGRLCAWENRIRDEAEANAAEGLNPHQLRSREQQRGEAAFRKLMAEAKAPEAVARFSRPWQPPAIEPEPVSAPGPAAVRATPTTPAVSHEILRLSLICFLAGLVQGRQSKLPQQPRIPGRGGVNPA